MAYINKTGSVKDKGGLIPDSSDHWTHQFSQTFLGGLHTCPEQARAKYFREILDDDHTDSTARGTAMHSGIEYGLYEKMDGRKPSLDDMVSVAHHDLDTIGEWQQTKYSRKKVYESLHGMLYAFQQHVLPLVEPAELEKRFNVLLYEDEQREIRLVGAVDCVDVHREVWDWKSAARPDEPVEKQRWAIQPTVYAFAMAQEQPSYVLDDLFHYAICFDDGTAQLLDVHRDETHVAWLRTQAAQVARMIEHDPTGPWPLNDGGWWCSEKWCPRFDICKGAHMTPEVWLKAPR